MTTETTLWEAAHAAFEKLPCGATALDAVSSYRAYVAAKLTASAAESRMKGKRYSAVEG